MKTLLLIDANSLIHRAYHALPKFVSKDGRETQAIYGVGSIMLKLWREDRPDYAAAAFDRPEPTLRAGRLATYKANRPETADGLLEQLAECHNLFPKFGVKVFELVGYEADDIIATLAEKFRSEENLRIVILSADMDTLQLVEDEKVVVRAPRKGVTDTMIFDEKAVAEKYGLRPLQIIDLKALTGDNSDNIKGVPGIGPKTATELLQKFGSVKEIYAHLDEIRQKEKLTPFKEQALFHKEIVTLHRDLELPVGALDDLAIPAELPELAPYFASFNFKSLVERATAEPEKPKPKKPSQGTIF